MNRTALVMMFVAVSSVAAAEETTQASWVSLTESMPLSRGRDSIRLDTTEAFSQLRFTATTGSSHIERVIVMFTDGTSQSIDLYAKLDASNPSVQFAIAPKPIDRVNVVGASSRRSQVQLFGL
jgi:hypothetical protein